jgi:transcriptional regulator with XRE-family HTH domain
MKNNLKIREILGLKQEEMAMFLRVTKSQWAMFETGKRNLTLTAEKQLLEMLTFSKQPQTNLKILSESIEVQEKKFQKIFESQLLINKHKQIIAERKIELTQRKYTMAITAFKFIAFLETNPQITLNINPMLMDVIKFNADGNIQKYGLHVQAKQNLKLETLRLEEKLITQKLQNL